MNMVKKKVIFISDQFGYRCGGSNTVNYELCMALRQITNKDNEIISLVLNCNEKDRVGELEQRAKNIDVEIIHQNVYDNNKNITREECEEICSRIFFRESDRSNSVWIGHDIFTGEQAILLSKYSGGMSVICIHTDYDTIEGLKGSKGNGIVKESKQRKIILNADKVFAIGPRLLERVKEVGKSEVYEMIPGISLFPENDLQNKRAIITFGRFEGTIAQIKQIELVLAAFGKAVDIMNNNRDYVLHIIGTPGVNDQMRLRKIAEKYASRKLSINFLEYTQDRKKLFSCLKNNCAGLMVSISEGFGLTGWEMISAGIPLILTKKSGLYDYLLKEFGYMVNGMCLPVDLKGSSTEKICEEDVNVVAEKIVTVFRNTDQLKSVAKELRDHVKVETWHNAAGKLAKEIGVSTMDFGITDIYSETYKTRQACIEEILNGLEIGEMEYRNLIFFGGISSALCEERLIRKLEHWLKGDPKRRLFLCYETGNAAAERAKELDEKKLPEDGLPSDPEKRMAAKERQVEESIGQYHESVQTQIKLIQIENSLMTYVIILDQNIYFTLLLETRSSEMMTMKIKEDSLEERRKIIESIQYVFNKQKVGKYETELLELIQKIK